MKNFNRGNKSGGGRGSEKFGGKDFGSRGGGRGFGGRGPNRPSMHQAVCDKCGKDCEVPFKPTGDRPVFCNDCFKNSRHADSSRFGGRDSQKPSFGDKKMYQAVCDKCGRDCEVPFQPTGGRPVYCSNCFGKGDKTGGKNSDRFEQQFAMLNTKLDKILEALTSSEPNKAVKKPVKKTVVPKKAKTKKKNK